MPKKKGLTVKQHKRIDEVIETLSNFGKEGDILLTACNLDGTPSIQIHKKATVQNEGQVDL